MFARFKRPVTIGFYRLRMATEQAERVQPYSLAEREANEPARADLADRYYRRPMDFAFFARTGILCPFLL